MNCPDCGSPMPVDKVIDVGDMKLRIHTCACGSRFRSEQRITGRLPAVTTGHRRTRVATGSHGRPPVDTGDHPQTPVAANPPVSAEGGGGGVSDPSNSIASSSPDLNPQASLLSEPRARAKSNRRATHIEYPLAFEAVWSVTDKTGSKFEAYEVWKRRGEPSADVIAAGWKRWKATSSWQEGYVWDVKRWLRGRCWEQEPADRGRAAGPRAKSDDNISELSDWMERAAR